MSTVRSSLTFTRKLALFSLLLVALCAPAWAERGKFGGVRYENPETGKIEYRDQATWTLTNGNLVISGGRFTSNEWSSLYYHLTATLSNASARFNTIRFIGTKLAPDKGAAGSTIDIALWCDYGNTGNHLRSVDLRGLDTSSLGHLVSAKGMFSGCGELTEVIFGGAFDTSKVTNMSWMFAYCSSLSTLDLSALNTSSVTSMYEMFGVCPSLETLDLSGWDTSSVNNMELMFYGCEKLKTLNLNGWNTSSVTNMTRVFQGCSSLKTLDLSSFNTSNVADMYEMFLYCESLKTILVGDGWDTSNLTADFSSDRMFEHCYSLVGEKGTKYANANPTDKTYARIDDPDNGKPGYLSRSTNPEEGNYFGGWYDSAHDTWRDQAHWHMEDGALVISGGQFTGEQWLDYVLRNSNGRQLKNAVSVTFIDTKLASVASENGDINAASSVSGMFSGWKKLQTVNMSGLETASKGTLKDMSAMFYECRALTGVTFGGSFNTYYATDMSGMFADCDNLELLNLKGLDTSSATDMSMMFNSCEKLEAIIVDNDWTTSKVTGAGQMFDGDTVLFGEHGTKYSKSNDDLTYARIDEPDIGRPGYLSRDEGKCFGGVYEGGEWKNQARWRIDDSGKLTITGGQFTRQQWVDYVFHSDDGKEMLKATSVSFSGTALAPEKGKTETSVSGMFSAWQNLIRADMSGLDTKSLGTLVDTSNMFLQCISMTKVRLGGKFITKNVTNMSGMFYDCNRLKSIYNMSSLDTSSVTDMNNMFALCRAFTGLDLSTFDTKNVTNMSGMFYKCSQLKALDLSMFDVKNVTRMHQMFYGCLNLKTLNLAGWDTGYAETMKNMFYNCKSLNTIRVGDGWSRANVMDSGEDMFMGCVALVGEWGTRYDEEHTDKEYARVDDPGALLPGYFCATGIEDRFDGGVLPQPVELTEEKVKQVRSALGSSLPAGVDASTVEVFTVNDGGAVEVDAVLRDDSSLSESEAEAVSKNGGVPAAILPEMTVKQAGVCCFFGVSLDDSVTEGDTLVWHPFPQADGDDGDKLVAVFMKDGEVITTVPVDHEVEVAAYFEAGTYAPVIAAAAGGGSAQDVEEEARVTRQTAASLMVWGLPPFFFAPSFYVIMENDGT